MPNRIGDLCVFSTISTMPYENRGSLFENIVSVATFFGFRSLPDELKIKIHICNGAEFKLKKEESHMNELDQVIAFSSDINNIFVLEYGDVNSWYSLNAYDAVILHECIHAFQAYYSMISPRQYIWLYESVACYLAKQNKVFDKKNRVPWDTFTNDFYRINDCYGLAYNFGEAIFKQFGDEMLRLIKRPEEYMVELMEIYNSKILEIKSHDISSLNLSD